MLQFSDSPYANLAELSASIIARCCETNEQQNQFAQAGAVPLLTRMLFGNHPKSHVAALDALGSLARENRVLAKSLLEGPNHSIESDLISLVTRLLHDANPSMRLIAATALTNIYRTGVIPDHENDIIVHVLPVLIKLFNETQPTIQVNAPLVLAYLVSESEPMQKAAAESDAVSKLATMLTNAAQFELSSGSADSNNERIKESALLAIAAVCSLREECRKQVIDAKVLSAIVAAMEHKSVGVRAAACQCTRSLSRSVKNLRTSLVDAGIALPLFKVILRK